MCRAGQVQARLRSARCTRVDTLDFAGSCLPGRAVGGDFYDFLEPTPGNFALILGDVSGHGVPAALMMAALQAMVRTHYALSRVGLAERVDSINRLFFDCTATEHYAALFVAEYDYASGRLRYANCGHVPPLLVRPDGSVTRPHSTGAALGMFDTWTGAVAEVGLAPDDLLVMTTDGILDAADPADGEFGELRLRSTVLRHRHLPPDALVKAITRDVRLSCGRRPDDDATVVVAAVHRRHDEGNG
ncbi:MAG: PP2C family protein-serine/threonine phosphatase [Vicinamibacterales bacterium]|jgi:serine phosphatase RsbU (regulator of sigma subunit)|nr:PP2C family protein-serine/threonine phosphatase [Vicinamibacterales bacterium]